MLVLPIALLLYSISSINGHGLLTFPPSKNGGTLSTPHSSETEHFALASFGIIDKAFFDNDHSITPWMRPGEFDFMLARDLLVGHPETLVSKIFSIEIIFAIQIFVLMCFIIFSIRVDVTQVMLRIVLGSV